MLVVAVVFIAVFGRASDLYIAPGGSDVSGAGKITSPCKTITKAQSTAASGDTVYLCGGTYYLDSSDITYTQSVWQCVSRITKDGIRYTACRGETPILNFRVQPVGHRVTAFLVKANNC
ncbi:MAG: hypothetical protein JXR25_15255 [Pontiellaceae bacterium]|nr:hypothetical protein [Pontiellaceae bacterium]MBN2786178.1 hypothetical protein [Pontiellaceae bacterium]